MDADWDANFRGWCIGIQRQGFVFGIFDHGAGRGPSNARSVICRGRSPVGLRCEVVVATVKGVGPRVQGGEGE